MLKWLLITFILSAFGLSSAQKLSNKVLPGYYVGTTGEGLPMGLYIKAGPQVTKAKIQFKLYRSTGTYIKDTTIEFSFNANIAATFFTAVPAKDSLKCQSCDVQTWKDFLRPIE